MAQPQGLTLTAGRYTITVAGVALGVLESNGSTDPTIEIIPLGEEVTQTDLAGDAVLDILGRGSNAFFQCICKEAKTGSMGAVWPFGAWGRMVPTGTYWGTTYGASLVLTAVAGTTAAANPATVTATYAVPTPNNATRLLYGPTLRKVPIRFQLLPYTSTNDVHFTIT